MMDRFISLLILLIIGLSANSQNPIKKILYTCGPNEDFDHYEFYSNIKIKNTKYACVTRNKNTSQYSFILNGVTIKKAKNLEVLWIDLNDKEKCIYSYSNDNNEVYLFIQGETFGPYENIRYYLDSNNFYNNGYPNYDLLFNKNLFWFKRMGRWYRHDNDGTVYECNNKTQWDTSETNPVYIDKSKNHKVEFDADYRIVKLDNTPFILPIPLEVKNDNIVLREFALSDDGVCICQIGFSFDNKYRYLTFVLYQNEIVYINQDEYFDLNKKAIQIRSKSDDTERQFESIERWINGKWINGFNKSFQDKYNKHFFTSNFEYDYVMIDDKKIKSEVPIQAFYDEEDNSFNWVTIEGKSLILYSYKL